jgi:hypothetical protein
VRDAGCCRQQDHKHRNCPVTCHEKNLPPGEMSLGDRLSPQRGKCNDSVAKRENEK